MKKKGRRLLSILLVFAMVLGMMPATELTVKASGSKYSISFATSDGRVDIIGEGYDAQSGASAGTQLYAQAVPSGGYQLDSIKVIRKLTLDDIKTAVGNAVYDNGDNFIKIDSQKLALLNPGADPIYAEYLVHSKKGYYLVLFDSDQYRIVIGSDNKINAFENVNGGGTFTCNSEADSRVSLDGWSVNVSPTGEQNQYTFTMPDSDVCVCSSFVASVTGISLDYPTALLRKGDELQLKATVEPSYADPTVTWSSGNEEFATVDETGKVTAVKEGIATITARATNGTTDTGDDKIATCQIRVTDVNNPWPVLMNGSQKVIFNGYEWYIIAANSTTVDKGDLTLLAAYNADKNFGTSEFDPSKADYYNSRIKGFLDSLTETGEFMNVAGAIKEDDGLGKICLLTKNGAEELPVKIRKYSSDGQVEGSNWWLFSTVDNEKAYFVKGDGRIGEADKRESYAIRPALDLDLSKVTFDSATNTFALLPTPYPLWVGGTQVTSANKDDVLGNADAGATVKYTPAQGTTPATLSLNGATISGGSSESKSAAIYAIGELTINVTGDNTVTGPVNQTGDSNGIRLDDNEQSVNVSLNITGSGTLTSTGGSNSKYSYGIRTWNNYPGVGDITIGAETTVNAVGQGSSNGAGIYSRGKVNVNGSLTATGNEAINGTVKNAIAGIGWKDVDGTESKEDIAINNDGSSLAQYIKAQFPAYTVTYKVVSGTWSDGKTADITENVAGGAMPDSVPTGMKASSGYTGGAWDTDPADATIMGATTFTYTFTAKQATTVTKAPEAKTLTYNGSAQELVTVGEAEGGEMQYALGTETEATELYTTSIPTETNAGTYYVWYMVKGDPNHNDTSAACVTVEIKEVDKEDLNNDISDSEDFLESIIDNDDYAEIADELRKTVEEAKKIADNKNVTSEQIADAIKNLNDALDAASEKKQAVDKANYEEAAKKAVEEEVAKKKEEEDSAAAKKAEETINALPSGTKVATTDKEAIEAARKAYDALTDDQKAKVPAETLKKLEAAEKALDVAEKKASDDSDKKTSDETDKKASDDTDKKASDDTDKKASDDSDKKDEKPDYENEWVDGQWYGADGNTDYTGIGAWKFNETGWWYEDSDDWYPVSQWLKIDGKWYYFKADGYMDYSEYRDGCWLGSDGAWDETYSGGHWMTNGTGWWYEDDADWYPVNQWLWIDGSCYYFYDTGYMAANTYVGSNWVNANGAWE